MFVESIISGFSVLTKDNLRTFLNKVTTNEGDFFSIETWKKAGYIGTRTVSYVCIQVLFLSIKCLRR